MKQSKTYKMLSIIYQLTNMSPAKPNVARETTPETIVLKYAFHTEFCPRNRDISAIHARELAKKRIHAP